MARGGLQFWHLVIIVLLAAMSGTALGDLIGKVFPTSTFGHFLAAAVPVGTSSPWDLDLRVVQLTLGATVRLSVLGATGAVLGLVLVLRRL
ncbi:MAG TPA: DUF4321 domain-containing protein [Candidatus Polarisedimenticolia bacterium]|nr:DUF4321 domain-containing protein [Candidatus Polarisedimenticolia bacterium]